MGPSRLPPASASHARARPATATPTKSSTGHLLGASGGVELIACAKALGEGVIPATYNLDSPDEECDLDFVPRTPRPKRLNIILSNSFGFGGHNACLLLGRYEG